MPETRPVQACERLRHALDARVRPDPSTALDAAVLDVETAVPVDAVTGVTDVLRARATRVTPADVGARATGCETCSSNASARADLGNWDG